MTAIIEKFAVLLLVASIVSLAARKMRLPYTVGLVFAGMGLALLHLPLGIVLSKELIFSVFLPPLIFEAALQIPWRAFRRDLPVTVTLATLGVLVSTLIVALGAWKGLGWPWQAALLLGVILSATDPVSVIATFKEVRVTGRLSLLVEAESLLNDGTAAVLFTVSVAALAGSAASAGVPAAGSALLSFAVIVFGGVLCGALVAGITLLLVGRADDHLIEIAFSTVAAFGSFLLAEHFHLSGVLATMTAGIILGNIGPRGALTEKGQETLVAFWEYAASVANSLIFLLIGVALSKQGLGGAWAAIVIVGLLLLVGRAAAVYGCCAIFIRVPSQRVPMTHQHILFWGGLRGALGLALALNLPDGLPLRQTVQTVIFGVVGVSIVVQGVTMSLLLKLLDKSTAKIVDSSVPPPELPASEP